MIELLKVIFYGIIEGITEWLPISSTGHLIIAQEFVRFGQDKAFVEMFNVVIQLGAIMAVVVLYFDRLYPFSRNKTEKERNRTLLLWVKVVIGCIPAGIGIFLNDFIEEKFNNAFVVAVMLILYGVLFIIVENRNAGTRPAIRSISRMPIRVVLLIGVFQMLAMIPGTSRSGATIIGGLLLGCARSVAAEFTFFMAIPVMCGASLVKIVHHGLSMSFVQFLYLLAGMAVSFIVSVFSIRFLMQYIKKHDFKAFGYYRIGLGAILLIYFFVKLVV